MSLGASSSVIVVFLQLVFNSEIALASADGIYFSMTDIRLAIPSTHHTSLMPLAELPLHNLGDDLGDAVFSETSRSPYFNIATRNGSARVELSPEFFHQKEKDIKVLRGISASIKAASSNKRQNQTTVTITEIMDLGSSLDCDFITQDLCFWKSVRYRIAEKTTAATLIGSLASPYLASLCPKYKITYRLIAAADGEAVPQDSNFDLVDGIIYSPRNGESLDRDLMRTSDVNLNVGCEVENPNGTVRGSVNKSLSVMILDVDDNAPRAQEEVIDVKFTSKYIKKGQLVEHPGLIFQDMDSPEVNFYKATILHDPHKLLEALCNKFENDLGGISRTSLHCKLKFIRDFHIRNWTYSVILQLNDTSLVRGKYNNPVEIPVRLHFFNGSGYHPSAIVVGLKQPRLYPSNLVKVFRTAAPLARITQPLLSKINGSASNFTFTVDDIFAEVFNITSTEGILFVHSYNSLRDTYPHEYARVNISWLLNGTISQHDEIDVRIVDEPTKTCTQVEKDADWWDLLCSEYRSQKSCLNASSCALGTGGSSMVAKRNGPQRCMWRGDAAPNETSHLYATCTPDVDTCPDGICDSLEDLYLGLCPQDCTDHVTFPASRNERTHRGIDVANGICTCTTFGCSCFHPPKKSPKEKKITTTTAESVNRLIPPSSISNHSLNPPQQGNFTGNILPIGAELAHCGTTCVVGIGAAALFLGGAAALTVICFRLDRVHKAVRGKLNSASRLGRENQELTAPLSDYVPPGVDSGGLQSLTFNMTTSLSLRNTEVLNIINKHAPDPKWEFPRSQLLIEQTLGEGEFGRVLRAKAYNIGQEPGYTTVAVKTLKEDARETELNDLLSEYQLLKEVSHPNVIRLLGVCTAPGGPIYLIIEFAEHGSLRNYLRRSRHLKSECPRLPSSSVGTEHPEIHYDEPNVSQITPKEILSFAWQISKGMSYLSDIKLVHRDLAARNVLLAENKICKISDFGLTRDIYEDDAYFKRSKGRVPVKWMAPESLSDHVYTNKSDVWSFGILIWELVTLGATPYPGIAVQNLYHLLRQGYRMERPDNCSQTLYNIMKSCWHIDPEHRPSFQELAGIWEKMLGDQVEYLDLANNAIHNRSYFCSPTDISDKPLAVDEEEDKGHLNYLSKSQSYIKCGSADKFREDDTVIVSPDSNQNQKVQGYETPVKVQRVSGGMIMVTTPSNENPQYYTDMASGNHVKT